jgi:hypothetical protein
MLYPQNQAAWVQQNLVGLGFSIYAGGFDVKVGATTPIDCGITPVADTVGTISGIYTNQFPMTIPIIDGSMYD